MEDKSVTNVEENRIIASSLCYRYPEAEKNAVDEVSMRVKKGEFLAILGHNGSGKSTLAVIQPGADPRTVRHVFIITNY